MFTHPYVDPDKCLQDPQAKARRLCPRCSKPDNPCCNIVIEPGSQSVFAQAEAIAREDDGTFWQTYDYKRYRWVCKKGCNKDGVHLA